MNRNYYHPKKVDFMARVSRVLAIVIIVGAFFACVHFVVKAAVNYQAMQISKTNAIIKP